MSEVLRGDASPRVKWDSSARQCLCLALLFISLLIQADCKPVPEKAEHLVLPSEEGTEKLIIDHLIKLYEQPKDNVWEEGKVYFLPEERGTTLLDEAQFENLRVYRANVWSVHLAPEKFPILVWIAGREGGSQLGVLAGPDEVASSFPIALKGLVFERPDARASLALLVGRMVDVFYGERSSGTLQVTTEGNCEWAEQVEALKGAHRRVAASCFSEDGVLETIVVPTEGATGNWRQKQ